MVCSPQYCADLCIGVTACATALNRPCLQWNCGESRKLNQYHSITVIHRSNIWRKLSRLAFKFSKQCCSFRCIERGECVSMPVIEKTLGDVRKLSGQGQVLTYVWNNELVEEINCARLYKLVCMLGLIENSNTECLIWGGGKRDTEVVVSYSDNLMQ